MRVYGISSRGCDNYSEACDFVVLIRYKPENSTICISVRGVSPQHAQRFGASAVVLSNQHPQHTTRGAS